MVKSEEFYYTLKKKVQTWELEGKKRNIYKRYSLMDYLYIHTH